MASFLREKADFGEIVCSHTGGDVLLFCADTDVDTDYKYALFAPLNSKELCGVF